ncbi:MAG: T9SS type A sorting domain-containing protein [Bacteroidota bacterium]|nr:T9SS type A sorting domain-containing protein [Bacteroidota bacterium]
MKRLFTSLFALLIGGIVFGQTLTDWVNENPGNIALSQETTTVQDGTNALGVLSTTDAQADTEVVSASFTVTPGANYTASAYIFDNDIAGKARIALSFDGTNEWGGYSNDGTDWELLEMTGIVPDGVTTGTVFFRFYDITGDWDGDFECILDNVVYSEDGGTTNLVTNASFENWEVLTATSYTITEIQDTTGTGGSGSAVVTEYVETTGIVTGVYDGEFTMQNGTGEWSGIWVAGSGVAMGDDVTVTGTVSENDNLTKILADNITVNTSGNALPAATVITTIEVSDEAYEGVLVEASGACTNADLGFGEWSFDDGSGDAVVDDYGLASPYVPTLTSNYTVTSPVIFSYGAFKLAVRQLSDIVEDVGTDPYLAITAPEDAAVLNVADVDVTFNVQNFTVADGTGDGYIVYTLNAEAPVDYMTTDPIALTGLADGTHTIELELVDNSGVSLDPAVIASVSFDVNTAASGITPIYDIQYVDGTNDSPLIDQEVTVEGVVTAVNGDNFWMQDAAGAWNGIYIYYATTGGPAIGDSVVVTGTVAEYYDATQIGTVTEMTVANSGNTPQVATITTAEANDESFESVLVQVEGLNSGPVDSYGQWPVNDGSGNILIDDELFSYTPIEGNDYLVTGIATYSYSEWKIWPRDAADVEDLGVSTDPAISITSPANGATIYTDMVDVAFAVSNFVLDTDGKVEYSIDGGAVSYQVTDADITFSGLTDGSHTVNLQLVDMGEAALDPVVTASITFTVNLAGPTITPIYDIQFTADPSGDSPLMGDEVIIEAVVVANFNGSDYGEGYYVQDAAGAWNGLYVYDTNNTPNIGDSVRITGDVGENFDMTQLESVSDYQTINIGGTVADPVVIATNAVADEQYESCFVRVVNAECTVVQNNYGEWFVNDGSGDVMLKDNGVFTFIESLGEIYNVNGVVAYSYSEYSIRYRIASDIEVVGAVNDEFAANTEVYPNPTHNNLTITNLTDVERVELISVTGQTILSENVTEDIININLESVASGIYMLKLVSQSESRVIRIEKN